MIIQSSRQALAQVKEHSRSRRVCRLCLRCASTAAASANRDPFAVLGLDRSAQGEDIKARYYDLVKEYHPDRGGQNTPEARETFGLIMDAYTLLRNPNKRAAYLQSGIGWDHGSPGPASSSRSASTSADATAADTGFHTGRRRAFDERNFKAASAEAYDRYKAAREMHIKSKYRWDPDYKGSKPGMEARDLDGIWTPYNSRQSDSTDMPVRVFVTFIVLALVIIINKPRKYYPANAGTEV